MDAVFERRGKKVGTALGEGGEQEHGILHVGDGVGARILGRKHATGFCRQEALLGDREEEGPLPFRADAGYQGFGGIVGGGHLGRDIVGWPSHARYGEAAHPAGRGVVGMVLAVRSFADDLRVSPAQTAEVHGEGDSSEPGGG